MVLTDVELRKSLFNCMNGVERNGLFLMYEFPEYILEEYCGDFTHSNWDFLSQHYKLSEKFIEKYANRISWNKISANSLLDEDFFDRHIILKTPDLYRYHINSDLNTFCGYACVNRKFSESFLEKHFDHFNRWQLVQFQNVSDEFIEKHKHELKWKDISRYCVLDEHFMEKWQDCLDWFLVSHYQDLSIGFIKKHKERINEKALSFNVKISQEKLKAANVIQ